MTVTLDMPLPPRYCQQNGPHHHWSVKAKARKQYRTEAFYAAREQHAPAITGPVRLSVVAYMGRKPRDERYRPTDTDGLISACKGLLDGLVDASVLAGDTAKLLSWGEVRILSEKAEHGGRTGLVVTLESLS